MIPRRAVKATSPRTEHRGAQHHSTSYPQPWIQRRAAETTAPQNRAPRGIDILCKTMDSKTRGRGNGAQNRAPRSMNSFNPVQKPWIQQRAAKATTSPNQSLRGTKSFKNISKTMDSKAWGRGRGNDARRHEPSTAEHEHIRNPI